MSIDTEIKKLGKKDLINLLNFHHFQGRPIHAYVRNAKTQGSVIIPFHVHSCTETTVHCTWEEGKTTEKDIHSLVLETIQIYDVHRPVRFEPIKFQLDSSGLSFDLPEEGVVSNTRRIARIPVQGVEVEILQFGVQYRGRLDDFSPESFRVRLEEKMNPALQWLNQEGPCTVIMRKEGEVIYSGTCTISRTRRQGRYRRILLSPLEPSIRRYRPRKYRSVRQILTPSPVARISHPISGKDLYLPVCDLSSTGVSVEESYHTSLLLPGMLIPELTIELANRTFVRCRAQVLYRKVVPENPKVLRCGLAFLDLSLEDQAGLSALLHPVQDPHTFVCNPVDTEELWQFFFESGFLYADKYDSIRLDKEEFKRTYEALYTRSPSISRYFIYREHGTLSAHMSMLRFYPRSWLIQHHAASKEGHPLAGVVVLKQVGTYVNEFHLHPSTRMDYVMCYFRPDNKFPNRVFGGVARYMNDPKRSSLDSFAYFYLTPDQGGEDCFYQLFPTQEEDLEVLQGMYEKTSGGLLIDALDLFGGKESEEELNREYEEIGFQRERYFFSVHQNGVCQAIFMVVRSNAGLNLSNLTNCIHAFILEPERLEPKVLFHALQSMKRYFLKDRLPILVYPESYMRERNLPYEKTYTLWVLSMEATDDYFKALESIFKRPMHG